jgi:hypothetical protein
MRERLDSTAAVVAVCCVCYIISPHARLPTALYEMCLLLYPVIGICKPKLMVVDLLSAWTKWYRMIKSVSLHLRLRQGEATGGYIPTLRQEHLWESCKSIKKISGLGVGSRCATYHRCSFPGDAFSVNWSNSGCIFSASASGSDGSPQTPTGALFWTPPGDFCPSDPLKNTTPTYFYLVSALELGYVTCTILHS